MISESAKASSKVIGSGYVQLERRRLVKLELELRQTENPRYSQRAFARDLGVSHALLSLAISGKRDISADFAQRLLEISRLPIEQLEAIKAGLPIDTPNIFERIDLEKFEMISDWTHYAVLSLLEVEGSRWDVKWMSRRLGQSPAKVKVVMNRLDHLGLIKKLESGRAIQATAPIVVENQKSSIAAKRFNRRLLQKATAAMDEVPFESRDLSSTVFTLNPKYIPYAIERIRNFRRSLSNELENLGEQTDVYALAVQLFPVALLEDEK